MKKRVKNNQVEMIFALILLMLGLISSAFAGNGKDHKKSEKKVETRNIGKMDINNSSPEPIFTEMNFQLATLETMDLLTSCNYNFGKNDGLEYTVSYKSCKDHGCLDSRQYIKDAFDKELKEILSDTNRTLVKHSYVGIGKYPGMKVWVHNEIEDADEKFLVYLSDDKIYTIRTHSKASRKKDKSGFVFVDASIGRFSYDVRTTEYPESLTNTNNPEVFENLYQNTISELIGKNARRVLSRDEITIDGVKGKEVRVFEKESNTISTTYLFLIKNKMYSIKMNDNSRMVHLGE